MKSSRNGAKSPLRTFPIIPWLKPGAIDKILYILNNCCDENR